MRQTAIITLDFKLSADGQISFLDPGYVPNQSNMNPYNLLDDVDDIERLCVDYLLRHYKRIYAITLNTENRMIKANRGREAITEFNGPNALFDFVSAAKQNTLNLDDSILLVSAYVKYPDVTEATLLSNSDYQRYLRQRRINIPMLSSSGLLWLAGDKLVFDHLMQPVKHLLAPTTFISNKNLLVEIQEVCATADYTSYVIKPPNYCEGRGVLIVNGREQLRAVAKELHRLWQFDQKTISPGDVTLEMPALEKTAIAELFNWLRLTSANGFLLQKLIAPEDCRTGRIVFGVHVDPQGQVECEYIAGFWKHARAVKSNGSAPSNASHISHFPVNAWFEKGDLDIPLSKFEDKTVEILKETLPQLAVVYKKLLCQPVDQYIFELLDSKTIADSEKDYLVHDIVMSNGLLAMDGKVLAGLQSRKFRLLLPLLLKEIVHDIQRLHFGFDLRNSQLIQYFLSHKEQFDLNDEYEYNGLHSSVEVFLKVTKHCEACSVCSIPYAKYRENLKEIKKHIHYAGQNNANQALLIINSDPEQALRLLNISLGIQHVINEFYDGIVRNLKCSAWALAKLGRANEAYQSFWDAAVLAFFITIYKKRLRFPISGLVEDVNTYLPDSHAKFKAGVCLIEASIEAHKLESEVLTPYKTLLESVISAPSSAIDKCRRNIDFDASKPRTVYNAMHCLVRKITKDMNNVPSLKNNASLAGFKSILIKALNNHNAIKDKKPTPKAHDTAFTGECSIQKGFFN